MGKWNKGGFKARFESDRSGFTYPRSELVVEPGTGLVIAKEESDGQYSLTKHPQNKAPKFGPERMGLKNPRPLRGAYKDSYLINDWDHSEQVNPNQPLHKDTPMTTEEGETILIEGYDE
jgi:hypothetical protein